MVCKESKKEKSRGDQPFTSSSPHEQEPTARLCKTTNNREDNRRKGKTEKMTVGLVKSF